MTTMGEQAYMDRHYGPEYIDFRVMRLIIARLKGDPGKNKHRFRGYIEHDIDGNPTYVSMSKRVAERLNKLAGREVVTNSYNRDYKLYMYRAPFSEFDSCAYARRSSKA